MKILNTLRSVFDLDKLVEDLNSLKKEQEKEDFWENQEHAMNVSKKINSLQKQLDEITFLQSSVDDMGAMIDLCKEDENYITEVNDYQKEVLSNIEKIKLKLLLNGKYDNNVAIITIHSGAGGTEAQDWTSMLLRMYQMYAEKNNFKFELIDVLDGDVAGIKSVTFSLDGEYAYGYMKAEKGVHRLVRISPFDSGARRHTSFASVEVVPQIESCDNEIEVRPEDVRVDTYRASGAGGQHINKTDSAVRLTHYATGIVVTCQNQRSQIQNRETAMQILKSKLLQLKLDEEREELDKIKGEIKKIEWGSQIRSYVLCPYTLVKDHRTGFENPNVVAVLDGDIQPFIEDYLKKSK